MHIFDWDDPLWAFGNPRSELSLLDEGCQFGDRALAWLVNVAAAEGWRDAGNLCKGSGQLRYQVAGLALSSSPMLPPTTVNCNSIEFKSLAAQNSQAAGPEALSNQGFYSYFNPQEVPAFLCLTKTRNSYKHRGWSDTVLRRKLSQILLWGKHESKSVCIVHCADLLFSIFKDRFS